MVDNKVILEDSTISYHFLCLHVTDPATFLTWNSVLGTLFSPESSVLIQWKI